MNKKDILEEAKKNLEGWLMQQQKCLQDELDLLKKCEFSDYYSFLQRKSEILEHYIMRLALQSEYCPFCLEYRKARNFKALGCGFCPYGKTHGNCFEDGSLYQLLSSIEKLFFTVLWGLYSAKTISKGQLTAVEKKFETVKKHLDKLIGRVSPERE